MYNILEHKQAIAENIQKAFSDTTEEIEKAKWQIGEIRTDSRGIAHECYEYTADGKPRLRRVKKNKGASTDDSKKQSKKPKIKRVNNIDVYLDIVNEVVDETLKKFPKGSDRTKAMYFAENKLRANTKWMLPFTVVSTYLTEVMNEYGNKTKDDKKEDDTQPQKKGNSEVDNFMKLVQKFSNKYTDESKVTVKKTPKGNWDVSYNGSRLGIINADQLSEKTAKAKGWLKEEDDKKMDESEKIDIQDYFGKRPTKGGKSGNELKLIYDTAIKAFNNSLINKDFSESNAEKFLKDTFKSFYFDDKSIENYVFYSLDKWKKAVKKYNDKNNIAKKQPKTLSEAKKGDAVAIVMERYNPQLGSYVSISRGVITGKTKKSFTVKDNLGNERKYDEDGDWKNPHSAAYGSVNYTILTESEFRSKMKDGKFNGGRVSSNTFDNETK